MGDDKPCSSKSTPQKHGVFYTVTHPSNMLKKLRPAGLHFGSSHEHAPEGHHHHYHTMASRRLRDIDESGESDDGMFRSETRRTSEFANALSARQPRLMRNKSSDKGIATKGNNMIEAIRLKLHSDRGESSHAHGNNQQPLISPDLDNYPEEELNEYREVFNMFDADRSGAIAPDELETAIRKLGLEQTRDELEKIIDEVDQRGNHQIDFDEFCVVMRRLTKKKNWDDVIRECFEVFDRSEAGKISKKDFQYILREFGDITDPQIVDEIFCESDVDGDGFLDFVEFGFMVKNYMTDDDIN